MNWPIRLCPWLVVLPATADTTINPALPHAYSANCGWIDLAGDTSHGVVVTEWFLAGTAWAANCGWIDFGNGMPSNGIRYGNASATDCGVNLDAAGNLSGCAYGANIGWIHFGWAAANDPNRPRIDFADGSFHGFAYGANIGWIRLGPATLATGPLAVTDTDADNIPDPWEREQFGSLETAGVGTDWDHDGYSDAAEAIAMTNPKDPRDFLKIVSQSFSESQTNVTLVFTTEAARRYRIEHAADLTGTWADSGLGVVEPDTGGTTTKNFVVPTATTRFFRVVVLPPLFH